MIRQTYTLELITPCFGGGAEPDTHAELRAPSIRGQLRWWFRILGGFRSLSPMTIREQEESIFGTTAGDRGKAAALNVRVNGSNLKECVKDGQELGHRNFSDSAYLTFPIQSREQSGRKTSYAGRGLLTGCFEIQLQLRTNTLSEDDLRALIAVFGHLGSLGFRGRRAMGALAFAQGSADLKGALNRFSEPRAIEVRTLGSSRKEDVIPRLGAWLKGWRAHGRSVDHGVAAPPNPPHNPGFPFAENDHDCGVKAGMCQGKESDITYRPALGLPIIQFFSSGKPRIEWNEGWKSEKARRNPNYKGDGRYASPILLRPHRDAEGRWHPLVIFVNTRAWPPGKPVFLNGKKRVVSLDLYDAMKADKRLEPFL